MKKLSNGMRIPKILAAAALLFSLTCCAGDAVDGLDEFRSGGFYSYPGLSWGCTAEEAAKATGWELGQGVDYYKDDGSLAYTAYAAEAVSFGGQQWTVSHLQFDQEGGLWAVSLMQQGEAQALQKRFDAMDKALAKIYGEADSADYARETDSGHISYIDRRVFDQEGRLVNSFALFYQCPKDGGDATLGIGVNWKPEGFETDV